MWYRKFVEAATAWEVLSTKEINWQGSFDKSFDEFHFYKGSTKMPTIVALRKFIDSITKKSSVEGSILDKYVANAEKYQIRYDLSSAINKLINFIDDYLSKGKLDTELIYVINFIGKLNQYYKNLDGKSEFRLGYGSSNPSDTWSVRNTLGIGYTCLSLLYNQGIKLHPSIEIVIAQNRDLSILGANDTDDRRQVKKLILESRPELKYFQTPEQTLDVIKNYNGDDDSEVENGTKPDFLTIKNFIDQFLGSSAKKFVDDVILYAAKYLGDQGSLDSVSFSEITQKTTVQVLLNIFYIITSQNIKLKDEIFQTLIEQIANRVDQSDLVSNKSLLLQNPDFVKFINDNDYISNEKYIVSGYSSEEKVLEYLEKYPENAKMLFNNGALSKLDSTKVEKILKKANDAVQKISEDSYAFIKKAEEEGILKIYDAETEFSNPEAWETSQDTEYDEEGNVIQWSKYEPGMKTYLDRLFEESELSGSDKEDLKAYASHMKIFEYDSYNLYNFAIKYKVKKLILGHVDLLSDKWSGLFVPRLSTPDGDIPAIFIKTNTYDTYEYHQELARSIKMAPQHYTESTRRHEIAHALQYLATGNNIATDSVIMNPEVTKEEAYLINPSEMYARVHGNIPYLIKIFDRHIKKLMTDPIIYEAAKEQWIHEMEDSLVHLSLGGTNTRRLMDDISNERGNFGWITDKRGRTFKLPDPQEAVNKTLRRQRIRLEEMFRDLYQVQGRRDFRLNLLKRRNALRTNIENTPLDSYRRTILEKELKKINEMIVASGQYLVFDVRDVSESVVEGYLTDYFGKLANAVSEGLIDRDVINPEGVDRLIEETQEIKVEDPEPPTSKDIRDIARFQIQMSEPIPSGRRLDVILPKYKGPGRPEGYYPQDKKEKSESSNITIEKEPEAENEADKFIETKKASYNHRRKSSPRTSFSFNKAR